MHELPYSPTDDGSSKGPPFSPCRPTVRHRSHSLQRKAYVCELAGSAVWLRSIRRILVLWRSRHSCVRSLFPHSSCAHRPYRHQLPSETTACVAAVTPLLERSRVNMPQLTAGVHFLGGGFSVAERLFVGRARAA
jgi:hypothetical protein